MKKLLTSFVASLLTLSAASVSAKDMKPYVSLMGGFNSMVPATGMSNITAPAVPPAAPVTTSAEKSV